MKKFLSKVKHLFKKEEEALVFRPRANTLWEAMYYKNAIKHESKGLTQDEALHKLRGVCKRNGFPELKLIPGDSEIDYYCGVMANPNPVCENQTLYNSVFIGVEETKFVAFFYWTLGVTN